MYMVCLRIPTNLPFKTFTTMKHQLLWAAGLLLTVTSASAADLKLGYDRPASYWVEALPLGNGRLGAMVYGGTESDTIQLNEDTFWSGSPYQNINREAKSYLRSVNTSTKGIISTLRNYPSSILLPIAPSPPTARFTYLSAS
jgi:hypothetical protein